MSFFTLRRVFIGYIKLIFYRGVIPHGYPLFFLRGYNARFLFCKKGGTHIGFDSKKEIHAV